MEGIVGRVMADLADFFSELNDDEDSAVMFGDYARVKVEGNVLTVFHETVDSGVRVTVELLFPPSSVPTRYGGGEQHHAD